MSNENETRPGTPGKTAGGNNTTEKTGVTKSSTWFDLQPRYLVNAGVFTVIYILVCWAVMVFSLLGPAFSLLGIVVSLLIGGVVVMLYPVSYTHLTLPTICSV